MAGLVDEFQALLWIFCPADTSKATGSWQCTPSRGFYHYRYLSRGLGASVKLLVGNGRAMGSGMVVTLWLDAKSSRPGATLFLWQHLSTELGWKVRNAHRLPAVRDNLGSSFFKSGQKAHGDGASAPTSFSSKRS